MSTAQWIIFLPLTLKPIKFNFAAVLQMAWRCSQCWFAGTKKHGLINCWQEWETVYLWFVFLSTTVQCSFSLSAFTFSLHVFLSKPYISSLSAFRFTSTVKPVLLNYLMWFVKYYREFLLHSLAWWFSYCIFMKYYSGLLHFSPDICLILFCPVLHECFC